MTRFRRMSSRVILLGAWVGLVAAAETYLASMSLRTASRKNALVASSVSAAAAINPDEDLVEIGSLCASIVAFSHDPPYEAGALCGDTPAVCTVCHSGGVTSFTAADMPDAPAPAALIIHEEPISCATYQLYLGTCEDYECVNPVSQNQSCGEASYQLYTDQI